MKCQEQTDNGGDNTPDNGNTDEDGAATEGAKAALLEELAGPVDPLTGQIVMLVSAAVFTAVPLVQRFRWRAGALGGTGAGDFYQIWTDNAGELGATNVWKISDQFHAYGSALIWGVAFIAQLLIMTGVEPVLGE